MDTETILYIVISGAVGAIFGAFGNVLSEIVKDWYKARPKPLAKRQREREALMTDMCIIERPTWGQDETYGMKKELDSDRWESRCRIISAGEPERVTPAAKALATVTILHWDVELPVGTAVERGDRILVRNRSLSVRAVVSDITDAECIVAKATSRAT